MALLRPSPRAEPDDARILALLSEALPGDRFVLLRQPQYKRAIDSEPVNASTAFGTRLAARIGHHNDCFLKAYDDWGTWPSPRDEWVNYVAADRRWVPMGGESCNGGEREV